jgi:hypothetical protein
VVDTVGTEAGEEDTMVEAGEAIMADIMAGFEGDTMEGSMVEVFTHIGDFGDGPMQAGPMGPMGGRRMWDGPTIHQR